jgi:O-antigen/teichoic acid export membrane protein
MSFLRKGILVSVGQVFCILLTMTVGILFSRQLGPDGMGQYYLLRSTATIVLTVLSAGLGNANIYFLNNRRVPAVEIATNAIKAGAIQGILASVCLTAALLAFPEYFGYISIPVAVLFALGVGASTVMWTLRSIIVARLAARRMVSVDLTTPAVLLIAGGALALFGWLRPQVALVVLSLGFFAALGLVLLYVRQDIDLSRRFHWQLFRDVLIYGIKLASANLLFVLGGTITVMLLRYLRPGEFTEVGLYSRALAVCVLIGLVPRAFGPLLYAKWSGPAGETRSQQAETTARMITAYGVLAAVAVATLGKYVLWLLYGPEFVPAQQALRLLAPAVAMTAVFQVYNNLLAGDGRVAITAYILVGTVVILSVVTWLSVPIWGIAGAALATVCGNAFTLIVSMAVCCRLYSLNPLSCLLLRRSDLAYVSQALRR